MLRLHFAGFVYRLFAFASPLFFICLPPPTSVPSSAVGSPSLSPSGAEWSKVCWENWVRCGAPEVRCNGEELIGAPMSDNGFVIIAMFFDAEVGLEATDESVFKSHCEDRARMGYNSGMGEIFRQVAGISPIQVQAPVP